MTDTGPHTCIWTEDDDGTWATQCGHLFVLNDGTPLQNDMAYCPYCGNRLHENQRKEANTPTTPQPTTK